MLLLRRQLTVICVLVLAGCTTTPDLAGWSQNSADLAGAIAGENREVLTRIEADIVQLKVGEAEDWNLGTPPNAQTSSGWTTYYQTYSEAADVINSTLDVMVLYANALAELAAAGETGEEAGASILGTLTSILDQVGGALPVGSAASEALKAVAELVTRVQAQDSLAETMTALQPAVDELAESIKVYAKAQETIVANIQGLEATLIEQGAGPNRMAWYRQQAGFTINEDSFESDFDVSQQAAVSYLLSQLELTYRHREELRAERDQWVRARKSALSQIIAAAEIWRQSHATAAEILRKCGGTRSLRGSCGNYTAANLKLAAERIRTVYEAGE